MGKLKLEMVAAMSLGATSALAQEAVAPSAAGTAVTPGTGTGPVSRDTGYSETGRGGTGGTGGGPSTSGTAAGAGTATGGNPSGYPDRN